MVLYEPRGAALEYAALATNTYSACPFACRYCYVPAALRRRPEDYHRPAQPRKDYQRQLRRELEQYAATHRKPWPRVHLCFVGDPYQPVEAQYGQTRIAIQEVKRIGGNVQILTKSADVALLVRDLPLLGAGDRVGVTLAAWLPGTVEEWEPDAPTPFLRLRLLEAAKAAGVGTWVSCEPVLVLADTLAILDAVAPLKPDLVWLGKLNHVSGHNPGVPWAEVRRQLVASCETLSLTYALKDSLKTL
jgi:DNA repair photolyase